MKKIPFILPIIVILLGCGSSKETESQAQVADTVSQTTAIVDTNHIATDSLTSEHPVDLTQMPTTNPTISPNNSVKPKTTDTKPTSTKANTSINNPTNTTTPVRVTPVEVPTPTTTSVRNPPPRPNASEVTPKPVGTTKPVETPKQAENIPQKVALSHTILNDLLKKYVSSTGKVDYKGIKSDKAKLEEYLAVLAANPPQSTWDRNKQLAFWINAYNANTIKLIVDNYPTESINKVAAKPWDKPIAKIGDKTYTLNQIENEVIRPTFKEPRIHFAVNCAAKSCPRLLNEAFVPEKLESQLEKMTKAFVNNKEANTLEEKKVGLSNIFNWYKTDFDASGGVIAFINKYADIKIKDNAKISYKDYNWNLNE